MDKSKCSDNVWGFSRNRNCGPERLRAYAQSLSTRFSEDLLAGSADAEIVRQVHPAHRTGGVDQKLGGPRNVSPFVASPVQEIVSADDFHLGIRKEWKG